MTLIRIPRAALGMLLLDEGPVPGIIGWEIVRDECGCTLWQGVRLDKKELCYGVMPCDDHHVENALVLHTLKTMPGQDVEMAELWELLLEEAIAS